MDGEFKRGLMDVFLSFGVGRTFWTLFEGLSTVLRGDLVGLAVGLTIAAGVARCGSSFARGNEASFGAPRSGAGDFDFGSDFGADREPKVPATKRMMPNVQPIVRLEVLFPKRKRKRSGFL